MSIHDTHQNVLALAHATKMHSGQFRKYTNIPYINHPMAVAQILRENVEFDSDMISAAYLHDVVEDTDTTHDEILCLFGESVYILVYYLTKVSTKDCGNRAARVSIDQQHLSLAPYKAQIIKLADINHNINMDLINNDADFAVKYINEKLGFLYVMSHKVKNTKFFDDVQSSLLDFLIIARDRTSMNRKRHTR